MSQKTIKNNEFEEEKLGTNKPKSTVKEVADKGILKKHIFWDTQPAAKINEKPSGEGSIKPQCDISTVDKNPLRLPKNYIWKKFDVNDEKDLDEFYELLRGHYVEDDDHSFRFKYSKDFIKWALCPPGYFDEWHLCVRAKPKGQMVAAITGIPAETAIKNSLFKSAEVNFLCIHKRLRSKRLAPVLIKELTRRVHLKDTWQAIYTAGTEITLPLTKNRYFHRQLNPTKLVEIKFTDQHPRLKQSTFEKLHALPAAPSLPLRPLSENDAEEARLLLSRYLKRFKFRIVFSPEEFRHWFLPKKDVINSYIVKDPASGRISDFISFYYLPSSILKNPKHTQMLAVYSFYNVATSVSTEKLFLDALVMAKNNGADVFNALDVMDNSVVFKNLKFKQGDGILYYYLYNWRCPQILPSENSVVLF